MTTILQYNGHGQGIPGIPAMDLDDSELSRLQDVLVLSRDELITQLTSRGLYSLAVQPKKPTKRDVSTDTDNEVSN